MWQRFSERARKVVFYAQEEAQALHHDYVGVEHLLLALLRESDSVAGQVLQTLGVSPEKISAEVKENLPSGSDKPSANMTLTPKGKRVINLAYDEARLLGNQHIGTEHLLLAIVRDDENDSGRILRRIGIELEAARETVQTLKKEYRVVKAPPPAPARPVPSPPPRSGGLDLPVRFDLRLLHPVDHVVLAILLDGESEFGKRLRQQCPSLDLFLPAIVATMADQRGVKRDALTDVLKGELSIEALYKVCVKASPPDLRSALADLHLFDPSETDEPK